ncbi:MAG: hypothetical protein ACK6DC_20855 [Planctomycetota bacterium]|jgi:hypothetical protein
MMDKPTPRILILVDITGAFLTCLITLAFLATNILPTGMPVLVLLCLGLAAACLGLFGAYRFATSSHHLTTLGILAFLNIDFCIASGVLWWHHLDQLTFVGRIYFPLEIVVISALALLELRWSLEKG